MNIGIVTFWFERGAAYVSRQYRDILEKDHEVYIYARGGEKFAKDDSTWTDGNITWNKQSSVLRLHSINEKIFKKWIVDNKLELVLFNEEKNWYPIILCNRLGVKTGAYIDYYTEATIPLFRNYDFLICNTKRHYSAFKEHPQCLYVPWGTDVDLFKPKTLERVDDGSLVFFHSAGYNPARKGTDLLLNAFDKLKGKARLVIHSQVELIHYFPDMADLIGKLIKEEKLVYIKETVAAPGLYHLGDIYVYPTRLEGIGLTIMEALSCGLPVITTNSAPMNEFVNNDNGKLVDVAKQYCRADAYYWPVSEVDIDKLYNAMQYYIDNIDHLEQFKKRAREIAGSNYNWITNTSDLSRIFSDVKKVSSENQLEDEKRAIFYDSKNMSLAIKIYRKYPRLFYVCRYLWLLIKKIFRL